MHHDIPIHAVQPIEYVKCKCIMYIGTKKPEIHLPHTKMSAFIPSKCDYNGEASPLYRIHSTNLGTFDYPFSCYRLAMYFQHTTSSGVPFYVNSIVDTVKKCMANPQISKNLVRFPVVPQKDFRYHS